MASVNDVLNNNANQLTVQAGQRPPPVRTESPPETQRPVPPTAGSQAKGGTDRLTISPQAQALAAVGNDNEKTESNRSGQQRSTVITAGRETPARLRQGAAQYREVQAQVPAAAGNGNERTGSARTEQRNDTVAGRDASARLRQGATQSRDTRAQAQTAANNDTERAAAARTEQRRNDTVTARGAPARLQQQGAAQYRALQALGAY